MSTLFRVAVVPCVFRIVFVFLAFCMTIVADAAEIVVVKPKTVSPMSTFAIDSVQSQYDKAWTSYIAAVTDANAAMERELKAQYDAAQAEGNLDLLKFWKQQLADFHRRGEFRWDPNIQRRSWDRFGGPAFPHSVTTKAQKAADDFARACATLRDHYKQIEIALVRLGDIEQAEKLRLESANVVDAPASR